MWALAGLGLTAVAAVTESRRTSRAALSAAVPAPGPTAAAVAGPVADHRLQHEPGPDHRAAEAPPAEVEEEIEETVAV
jgi:hypothetical protein